MKIPKLVHRIWVEGSPLLPDEYAEAGERWRELHPDWIVQDWTFPPFPLRNKKLWDEAPEADALRYRSDLLRLELLARYGGVYVDMDVVPLRPFDSLLEGSSAFAGYSPDRWKGERVVTNAIIGAAPFHPWILRAVETAEDSVREFGGSFTAMVVGPHHVNRALDPDDDVLVLDAPFLYPRTKQEGEAAFSYHMWATRNGIRTL